MATLRALEEFEEHIGKNIYIINSGSLFVAATTKKEINDILKELDQDEIDTLIFAMDNEDSFIYGLVLNPRELPYEIPEEFRNQKIYLLNQGLIENLVDVTPYGDIEEVVEEIESLIEDGLGIDEIVVILGKPVKCGIQILESTIPLDYRKMFI